MTSLAVTLTVEELEELLSRAVKKAIRELDAAIEKEVVAKAQS